MRDAAAAIRARRLELGWSVREVGRRTGVHFSDVSRAERGERQNPEHLRRIAEALGLDPDTLVVVRDVADAPEFVGEAAAALGTLAAAVPGLVVAELLRALFPPDEWTPAARTEGEELIRGELERAMAWTQRVEDAYAAARAPMAASAGVPAGAAEERLFLRRMRRALEKR